MSKFIISCGGTGGHLVPGIAVGQALMNAGHEVSFMISRKQVDARLVQKYPNLDIIKTPGVAFSKNPIKFLRFLRELVKSVNFGRKTLREGKYDVAMTFGGFTSLGISIAAKLEHVPLVLHEANRKPGKAVRLLGGLASRIYVPYGVKIPRNKSGQVKNAGYPIRDEIRSLPQDESKAAFGFEPHANILLILGGSQGAAALNEWANSFFFKLAEKNIDVLCVCGPGKHSYEDRDVLDGEGRVRRIKFLEFCDNMAAAMSASKVIVARAGAGTIAELARCRVPSVIIPYPFAADNHQQENAKYFEKQGACAVIPQNHLHKLFGEVVKLMENDSFRKTMEQNLERVDDLNDTSRIVADLEEVARTEKE